ncbi:MAG: CBS domain-containing protein [Phycisphaera sp.]|nr:CBS domain-containing protein [Phycisphaera sp.]
MTDQDPRSPRDNGVDTSADRDRIDRFEAAYNRIDREMQRLLNNAREGHRRGFASSVRQVCSERRHFGRHLDFLLEAGELRNALVHNRFGHSEYIAVPTAATVTQLERIDEELRKPVQLRALAAREVVTVSIDDRVGHVLALVRDKGFVRFPVTRDGRIVALLTASGVLRWVASHDIEACAVSVDGAVPRAPAGALDEPGPTRGGEGERIICTIAGVRVGEVLARDHRRDEFAIVPRDATADAALSRWTHNPRLEAIIVTENGKPDEKPLGIATATDLIKLLDAR